MATNFSVSSRQGFKLWGLLPWGPSCADPCLSFTTYKHGCEERGSSLPRNRLISVAWLLPVKFQAFNHKLQEAGVFRETKHGVLNIVPVQKNMGNKTFLQNFWKSFNAMGVSIQVYSTKLVHNLNILHIDKGLNNIPHFVFSGSLSVGHFLHWWETLSPGLIWVS